MAVVASAAGTGVSRSHWLTRLRGWHPESWVYAVAALAWLDLVLMAFAPAAESAAAGHHDHVGHGVHGGMTAASFAASLAAAWSHWGLMVAAMMLPVVAPQVRNVAMRSLWPRRQRSAIAFAFGYTAVWVAAGAGVRSGVRCLATCGPLMLAMVASHSLLLMAGLLVVLLTERSRGPDPVRRAGRPLEAWVIVGFAAAAGFVALPLV